jgi:hypothetical protein
MGEYTTTERLFGKGESTMGGFGLAKPLAQDSRVSI